MSRQQQRRRGGGNECRERRGRKVRVMGMFACFQGIPPCTPKRCPPVISTCWGDNPDPPDSPIVRGHNRLPHPTHDLQVQESKQDSNPSPPRLIPEPRILSRHRQAAADPRNNFQLRTKSEDRNLPLLLAPPPPVKPRNPFPLPPQQVVEDRNLPLLLLPPPPVKPPNPSPPLPQQVVEDRKPSPPRQVAEVRVPSPTRDYSRIRNPSPPKQVLENRKPSDKPSATRRLAPQRNCFPSQEVVQDRKQPPRAPPTQSAIHRETSPIRYKASDYFPETRDSPPPTCEITELVETKPRILHPGSRKSSPSRNAVPVVFPSSRKKSRRLNDNTPPFIRCQKIRETPSDCYSSTPCSNSDVVTFKFRRPIVCRHQHWKHQMGSKGLQDHHEHQWVNHDADHIDRWEEYNSGSEGGQTLAKELHREVALDLAEEQARKGGRPGSPQSPRSVTESCADSYCSRAENPLRQKSYEPKFPYGTPEVHAISLPGWTYAPKRKNKKGEWWDKDWPKNKRYIYSDPNVQPCGCTWGRKHPGTQTPSPPSSARARGMAYADKVVKINRARSLSPQPKSRPKSVPGPTSEHPAKHPHRHVHLNWSCSNNSRTSSRSPLSPVSRAITPTVGRKVIRSSTSTPVSSPPQSPTSTQLPTPRTNVRLAGSISRDQHLQIYSGYRSPGSRSSGNLFPSRGREQILPKPVPFTSSGGGYSAPLSQSATPPWSLRQEHKPVPNVRNYPDSPCTSSSSRPLSRGRVVRSRASAPLRQRPNDQKIHIYLSSSSGRSTPCSISVRRNPTSDGWLEDQGRRSREKYVGTMGHCHTPGSWSCTPQASTPTTPRSRPTPTRKSDYTVTITCPPHEDMIDDGTQMPEPELSCHCPCTQNYIDQGCCNDQFCQTTPRRVIGGPSDWHQIVHHHRPVSHCCCGWCHC